MKVSVNIITEWKRVDNTEYEMVLKCGDSVLAVVKKMGWHEKNWRIIELCGQIVCEGGSIDEIYFETLGEAVDAVESHFERSELVEDTKELEPKIFTDKDESIEDAIKTMTNKWIRNGQYCDVTLFTLKNWIIWKLKEV